MFETQFAAGTEDLGIPGLLRVKEVYSSDHLVTKCGSSCLVRTSKGRMNNSDVVNKLFAAKPFSNNLVYMMNAVYL
jgi:hypothetical protein